MAKTKRPKTEITVSVKNTVSGEQDTVSLLLSDTPAEVHQKIGEHFKLEDNSFKVTFEGDPVTEDVLAPSIELEIIAKVPCKFRNGTTIEISMGGKKALPNESISLYSYGRPSNIYLNEKGIEYEWGGRSRPLVGGNNYLIVPQDRSVYNQLDLSADDITKAGTVIRSAYEGHLEIPPPMSNDFDGFLWLKKRVTKELNQDDTSPSTVAAVWEKVIDDSHSTSSWRETLKIHPHDPKVNDSIPKKESLTKLSKDDVVVYVYHRALNRYPGGNSENVVARHEFDPNSENEPQAIWFVDGDGNPYLSKGNADCGENFTDDVLGHIKNLLKTTKKSTWLFESTITDEADDSDEYDTEWSSIDILVYSKPVSPETLIARIHQYSLCPNIYDVDDSEHKKASKSESAIFTALEETLEMGRPEDIDDKYPDLKDTSDVGGFFPLVFALNDFSLEK
eukprot:TRINITY_DN3212_c0_g1_i1.p1 TRINITY_DN3212_c0_g1~~TRINITY_DN3212_c0_g1_i1.p1  ORF type:complete len:449 (+),score=110.23 TRINITY_DN3212_c0_g1_i1:1537-2883(+)